MAAPNHVADLQDAVHNLLNQREQTEFVSILSNYRCRNNIQDLVHGLLEMLDTPAKGQLAQLLRKAIPSRDLRLYDELMGGGYTSQSLPRRMASHKDDLGTISKSTGNLYRAGSTLSIPAGAGTSGQHYGTLPSRQTGRVIQRQQSVPQDLNRIPAAKAPMWDVGLAPRLKRIRMSQPNNPNESLGFSIRGGAEHGIGIYVSYVDVESLAERQGLVPGDQILSVNGIPYMKIFHDEAAKIVKDAKHLDLEVRNVGRVPGSFETHQTYMWVDPVGRTVSPPPEVDRIGRYENTGERKSGLMLLKDSDERKVHIVLSDNQPLGLMIRGGNEFGLGIYITSIDITSVAENAGLKVGDQILDVNGQSFLDISHMDAVKVIKGSRRMVLTIKDVSKLPFARTTFDHTKWVLHQTLPRRILTQKDSASINGNGTFGRSSNVEVASIFDDSCSTLTMDSDYSSRSVFMRGAGSQLMLSSMSNKQTQWGMVEEKGRSLLNDAERTTLSYYLGEYQQGTIHTEGLVLALLELFNTHAKFSLMSEVRGTIAPRDLEKFDELILHREIDSIKSPSSLVAPDQVSNHSLDSLSNYSVGSGLDSLEGAGIFSPLPKYPPDTPAPKQFQDSPDGMDPLRVAIEQINGNVEGIPDPPFETEIGDLPPVEPRSAFKPIHPSITTASVATAPTPHMVVAEVHQPPHANNSEKSYKSDDMRSPSEDSGVELNGVYSGDFHDHQLHRTQNQSEVTVSTQKPVIINDMIVDENSTDSTMILKKSPQSQPMELIRSSTGKGKDGLSSSAQLRVERREATGHVARDLSPSQHNTWGHHRIRDKSPARATTTQAAARSTLHIPKGQVSNVTLRKLRPTLGIAIEGGANTRQPLPRIINIQPGGSAYESGGLKVGHIILEVNGKAMHGLEHREAAKSIAEAFKNKAAKDMQLTLLDAAPDKTPK